MDLTLDHTFTTDALLAWYQHASTGDVCQVHIPAMQNWMFTITKGQDSSVLLHPDGHRPQSLLLDVLLDLLQSLHCGIVARATAA